ncbi:MAG: AraC family transcriptional regulator [Hyphomicrobiales bacterium]|nr:AraC family transcriptional regulator [Hyphomicrobiales bacterium]
MAPSTIRSAALANFADVARQVGLDPFALVRRVGIDARALTDGDLRVSAARVAELLECAASDANCPTFGLRMAESRKTSDFGAVSLVISHQATLRDVLETMVRYRNLLNSTLALHVEMVGDIFDVKEELVVDFDGPKTQSYELAVGILSRLFRSILGDRWRPVAAHFTHARPADTGIHRRLFGERVEFDADFNGLSGLASDLDRANVAADPALARYAHQFVETLNDARQSSMEHETRKAVYLLLPLGGASIERVARSLGVHERTLQRRLAEEGVEFSDLVNGVRRELVERYLANPAYSLTRIAEMLGYGQLSSFTRWFAAQFGAAPSAWRKARAIRAP